MLVNNAGIHADAVFPGMSGEQWDRVLDVSLNGFYNVTQPLTLPMLRTRWGRIVNMTSVAAIAGNRGQVNYAAAKEWARFGVTVNAVAPGIIATRMTDAFRDDVIPRIPLGRAGTPEDVAEAVAFFCSPGAGYITGQILEVAGGVTDVMS